MSLESVYDFLFSSVPNLDIIVNTTRIDFIAGFSQCNARDREPGVDEIDRCLLPWVPDANVTIIAAAEEQFLTSFTGIQAIYDLFMAGMFP
jgi:hypothetical protein